MGGGGRAKKLGTGFLDSLLSATLHFNWYGNTFFKLGDSKSLETYKCVYNKNIGNFCFLYSTLQSWWKQVSDLNFLPSFPSFSQISWSTCCYRCQLNRSKTISFCLALIELCIGEDDFVEWTIWVFFKKEMRMNCSWNGIYFLLYTK